MRVPVVKYWERNPPSARLVWSSLFSISIALCVAAELYLRLSLGDFVLLAYAILSFPTVALVGTIVLARNRPQVPYWELASSKSSWPTSRQVTLYWMLFLLQPHSADSLFRISSGAPALSVTIAVLILAIAWNFAYANWSVIAGTEHPRDLAANPCLQLPSAWRARLRPLRGLHPAGGFEVESGAVVRVADTVALAPERQGRWLALRGITAEAASTVDTRCRF